MDSFTIARADFFDQYLEWWRRFFADAMTWTINHLAHSPEVTWGTALRFANDYLLLPLVVVVGLLMLLKQTLSD